MHDLLHPLTDADVELIEIAKTKIKQRYRRRWHQLAAAMRTKDGKIYTGIHIDAYVSSLAVCAEQVTLGTALTEGEVDIDTIVAVRHPKTESEDPEVRVVTPCGRCREMICDYGKDAWVIISHEGQLMKTKAINMLPEKYYLPGINKGN
ncbi:MAG: cytidine deaminase [Magnetococcales bacterium]|nr:cytidine deaminase [Magnetococcales bacterium]